MWAQACAAAETCATQVLLLEWHQRDLRDDEESQTAPHRQQLQQQLLATTPTAATMPAALTGLKSCSMSGSS